MRGLRIPCLVLSTLALALGADDPALGLEDPRMDNLRVLSGEGPWQAESRFDLGWDREPAEPAFAPTAVAYQLYDGLGSPVGPVVRITKDLQYIYRLPVPSPGVFAVEAWFEDASGHQGPRASTTLRYDPAAPSPPQPLSPGGWIGGGQQVVLSIGHPDGALPPSGIRGYAFSVDRGGGSSPCASDTRCTLAETDLAGGIGDDRALLGHLPEGANVVRVVAVSGAGVSSAVATASVRVDATPPSVRLSGAPAAWASGPVALRATAADSLSGMAPGGPSGPFTAIAIDGGRPRIVPGDAATAMVAGSGVHSVAFFARDAAGNVTDGTSGAAPETATVRIDEDPPQVRFSESQDPAEPERIEALVEDGLSGPSQSRGEIGIRPVGGKGPFQPLPTKVLAGKLQALWNSDAFPEGKYEFRATGYDAAGNSAAGSGRARGGRMVLVNPVKTPTTIESGFPGRKAMTWRPGSATLAYGRRVRFGGRLRTRTGAPLADRQVEIVELFGPGAEPARRTTLVRTDGSGAFSIQLRPGPSRQVTASFAGSRLLTDAAAAPVRLDVLAGVRLRSSSRVARVGGSSVVFRGELGRRGAALARLGKPVELQFRYPGAGWSEFRTVQSDSRGRFRYAYGFTDDDSRGVRFQFRACLGAEDDWPYEPACSKPITVEGR